MSTIQRVEIDLKCGCTRVYNTEYAPPRRGYAYCTFHNCLTRRVGAGRKLPTVYIRNGK